MSQETTVPGAQPLFDVFNPERIDLTALSNAQKDKLLQAMSDFILKFDYIQHLEDCYWLTFVAQDYGFDLPVNFYSNNKNAIELQQKAIDVVNRAQ